ncbi:hypothetical protein B0H13DRAFT_2210249 [Mycena leptocephala]|nr:hypothetical protein B0H13DRAFT_2210249 [Mycena leptocephala]
MSSSSSSKSAPNSPQTAGAMRSRAFKTHSQGPVASKSDWLAPTIVAARMITAAGECLPFPYVKGAFGMVVIFLETVEKVKKNRDDLKDLCTTALEIMDILQDQISLHGDTGAVKLKGLCEDFERFLEDVIHGVEEMRKKPQGFRAHIKEFVKLGGVQDKIAEYQKNIQEICSRLKLLAVIDTNFQVHKINATLATVISPNITVVQAARQMNNCPPPSRIFQGRQTILDKMNQFFAQDIGKQHIYVLHGLGGAGKTQIALKFINASLFADIFFLDASTIATIDTGLKSIATSKNTGSSSQDALKWLATNQEDWLLFYDNADDPKIDLNRFIPQCNHGNIIITTRNPALRSYAGAHFAVSDMEETDAVALLLKSASQDISSASENIAAEIVKELCYLPLAIVQAGAFILQSGALDTYLDIYMKNRAQLLSEKPVQTHDNYAWTVYTTWQMSFEKLSPLAAMFLQLCSFLHQDGISEDIFSRAATYRFQLAIPFREELQKPLEFLAQFLGPAYEWDTFHFLKVTNEIKAYSLMTFDPERKMFSIHPLVHSWSRTTITDQQSYHPIMAAIMGMSIAEIPDEHQQLASLRLISHVDSLRHGNQQMIVDFGGQYGMIYYHAARYEEAKGFGLAVLEKQKQVLGDNHSDTFQAMANLASTYQKLGQFHKAEQLEVVVLEKRKQVLGDDHPDTLLAMGNLASTYQKLGKFHRAEELKVAVLEKRKQVLGDNHPYTLRAMGNLASIYHSLGQSDKAEELEVVVLEMRKQVLGDDHPDTLQAMGNLATAYNHLGKFQQAEELEVIVLEKRKQVLGDDHPDTLRAMGNLATTYGDLGKFQQAEELQVIVLEKQKQVLGDDHPDTLWSMGSLASAYHSQGDFHRAQELELFVLDKRKQVQGDDHPDTLRATGNLGCTYHQLGQFQKAEELQVIALEERKKFLGANHPDTLHTMRNLASTYRCLEKLSEAEELEAHVYNYEKALEGSVSENSEGSDEEASDDLTQS